MSTGFAAFEELAGRYTHVPVARAVLADLETPVAALWKVRRGAWSFLLESVEGGETQGRYTLLGTEPKAVLTGRGCALEVMYPATGDAISRTFPAADGPLREVLGRYAHARVSPGVAPDGARVELPRLFGGLVGALAWDAARRFEVLPDRHPLGETPDFVLLEAGVVLVWDNVRHRATLTTVVAITPDARRAELAALWEGALRELDAVADRLAGPLPELPSHLAAPGGLIEASVSDAEFEALVREAKGYIGAGDVIQVVLSRRFSQARGGVHPFSVYRSLRALNPSPFMFYLELGATTLVGASPELLVRVTPRPDGGRDAEVRPIAGTRRRGASEAEDGALASELAADPKERAEHVMLVDLGRNDVGRLSEVGSVRVEAQMVNERYSHVLHLVSHVRGALRPEVTPADVVAATFPAGTLSGAPKIRAMELIDALEPARRGFYGGAVGTLSPDGSVDLAIAIRTLVADDETLSVQAGAGVVWDSDPEGEAAETRAKASAVLRAVALARETFAQRAMGAS